MVLEVHKNIGDQVRNGEAVAVLESNDSLTPYTLKSRIDGTVIAKHITLGESLNDSHSCYTIADLSNVWINITLYQKDLNLVKKGQSVTVYGGEHMQPARGRIAYVSPILDEHTRTGCARVVLPNPDGRWKPGMFITAEISIGSTKAAVAIPPTAIHTINGSPAVFVLNEDGFEPRPVKTGHANRNLIEISDGLKTGEQYAAKGGFTLKAELGRGNLHSGHNH
jgi:cobalt-zinc-cadmium efflux system membrane fusion protein